MTLRKLKKFFGEFKEFIARGNVLDLAVGVIIATSFGKITTSLVNDIIMPFIGWLCVHTLAEQFEVFAKFIPWIALVLLSFIGGKMLLEGIKACRAGLCDDESVVAKFSLVALVVQGIATSIDALSVGFTIAEYDVWQALLAVALIAAVTFVICLGGVLIGKKFGAGLSGKATILGGSILVIIGIYIFITGMVG